jgi:hypothetical protein
VPKLDPAPEAARRELQSRQRVDGDDVRPKAADVADDDARLAAAQHGAQRLAEAAGVALGDRSGDDPDGLR